MRPLFFCLSSSDHTCKQHQSSLIFFLTSTYLLNIHQRDHSPLRSCWHPFTPSTFVIRLSGLVSNYPRACLRHLLSEGITRFGSVSYRVRFVEVDTHSSGG